MRALLLGLLVAAPPAFAQGILDEWGAVRPPPAPAVSRASLEPGTTALLVLDLAQQTCNTATRPRCVAMLPKVAKLIAHARDRHWTVIYTIGLGGQASEILPPVARLAEEPVVAAPPDKFVHTALEDMLHQKGIRTVVTVGAASEGAVMETAAGAAFRGFAVVVPLDGIASGSLYAEQYAAWDLVNAPRLADRVTLSAIGLID